MEISFLKQTIEELNICYLVIDPIMGCLGPGIKTGDDASVRRALQPLRQIVAQTGIACVLLRHFKKGNEAKAIYQGGGSIAFSSIARIGLVVAHDPDNERNRVIATAKANLIADEEKKSILYTISSDGKAQPPYVSWLGVSKHQANDVIQQSVSQERHIIMEVLQHATKPMSPKEVAEEIGESTPNVSKLLAKMAQQREIVKTGYGKYGVKNTCLGQNLDQQETDPSDPSQIFKRPPSTTTLIQVNKNNPSSRGNLDHLDHLDQINNLISFSREEEIDEEQVEVCSIEYCSDPAVVEFEGNRYCADHLPGIRQVTVYLREEDAGCDHPGTIALAPRRIIT